MLKSSPAVVPPNAAQSLSSGAPGYAGSSSQRMGSAVLSWISTGSAFRRSRVRWMSACVHRGWRGFAEVKVSPTDELPMNVCRATAAK